MAFYILSSLTLILLIHRIFRSERMGERIVLLSLFLFLLLTLAVHPWLMSSPLPLRILENAALSTSLVWLVGDPVFRWFQKRKNKKRAFEMLRNGRGPFSEIVSACRMLAEARQGALIAIQRKDSLERWVRSGIPVDSKIRREIIYSVFTPPGALHDGGMVIQGDRIAACGVIFPLSKRLDLPTELGTRHRAALGMSEAVDVLAIVVSEETGKISFADKGSLLYDIKAGQLEELLESVLKNRLARRKLKPSRELLIPLSKI